MRAEINVMDGSIAVFWFQTDHRDFVAWVDLRISGPPLKFDPDKLKILTYTGGFSETSPLAVLRFQIDRAFFNVHFRDIYHYIDVCSKIVDTFYTP